MAKTKENHTEDSFEAIQSSLTGAEQFIEKNQKVLVFIVAGILAIVGIVVAYQKWYAIPKENDAHEQMYVAEDYFERDSFNLALNGDGNYPGFLGIIDDYSSTHAGNLAKYYAGVSYYNLGDYDNAIDYLEDFSASDKMVAPIAKGCTGDAYSQKKEYKKAVKYYLKAASMSNNDFTAPIYLMKAGRVYESLNDWKSALDIYQKIKKNYKDTKEGKAIDKFITRAKLSL